jgi:hypothetical protein
VREPKQTKDRVTVSRHGVEIAHGLATMRLFQ